jgi:hypothetical protein
VHLVKRIPKWLSGGGLAALLLVLGGQAFGKACADLIAGQHTLVGTVCVGVADDSVQVEYTVIAGWSINSVHFFFDDKPTEGELSVNSCPLGPNFPMTDPKDPYDCGNPKLGHFTYNTSGLNTSTYVFSLPLNGIDYLEHGDLCGSEFNIVAHADVTGPEGQTEGAWAVSWGEMEIDGQMVSFPNYILVDPEDPHERPRGNWGFAGMFDMKVNCEGSFKCETAFAKGDYTFETWPHLDFNSNRWGWLLGPFGKGFVANSESFPLYAGAGQNDISKGALAGVVTVSWDTAYEANQVDFKHHNVAVSYNMNPEWFISSTAENDPTQLLPGSVHIFIGAEGELLTTAPGQYTYVLDQSEAEVYAYSMSPVTVDAEEFWVVAHAEVCSFVSGEE